jgi:DNA invertase Pin-like site-specific DNA recombinase
MPRTSHPSPSPSIVVGFVRASTDRQDLSPDAQRASLARWCDANGARLVAVHEDLGVSGAAPLDKRPGLLAAIDALKVHGAGVLLVAKRDRLARDVFLAAMIERLAERHGARVLSADGSANAEGPEGSLFRNILNAFAEYERALIRARTKAALAVKAARGERTGGVPYGLRLAADGFHVETNPEEAAVVERVRALRAEGRTLRAIGADLDGSGYAPRGGGRWHPQTVANIVRAA